MNSPFLIPCWIALGAIPGALSRYYLTIFSAKKIDSRFPYGTLIVNLSGSFFIGLASELLSGIGAPQELKLFVLVGFLGSYTTFSTYELDADVLFEVGGSKPAFLYWLGSPILGAICVELGAVLAQKLI